MSTHRPNPRWPAPRTIPRCVGLVALALALVSTTGRAADSLGVIAERVLVNLPPLLLLATAAVFAVGFVLVGTGGWKLWQAGRHPGVHGAPTLFTALMAVIAGVAMVYHSTVIGMGGATLFGSSENDVTIQGTVDVR